MSAQSPSTNPPRRRVHHALQNGLRRTIDAVLRASDSRSQPENVQLVAASHAGTRTPSRSRPPTPLPDPDPTITSVPDGYATLLPSAPYVKTTTLADDTNIVTEQKYTLGGAWAQLSDSLNALESSVAIFPPLQQAVGAFVGCLSIIQKATSNRKDQAALIAEFRFMADVLSHYHGGFMLEPINGSVANLAQSIELEVAEIEKLERRGRVGRFLDASRDEEDVVRRYRLIESLFRRLHCDITMRTHDQVQKQYDATLLRGMSPVDDAKYNSSYSTTIRRRPCTATTRQAIHETLQDWTTNPQSKKIYWMNGMAGTGKTTIAYSYCEWLEKSNRLGASFFCSRISPTCRSLNHIIPTIAYRLAKFSPAFHSKLCATLNGDPDAGKLNVVQQFEKLINGPMLQAKDTMPDDVVIVIDALDECDDMFSVHMLLDLLLKFAEQLPLKFFVSSRPEPVIRERMMSQGGAARSIIHLHDIEESIVVEDIKKYLTEALGDMAPAPSPTQIDLLAKRSRNLFIYAATVVRYIYPQVVYVDSSTRLEAILVAISDHKAIAENKYDGLDRLYTTVLSAVFNGHLDSSESKQMESVLWTIVCVREPITVVTLASLSNLNERQVWAALQSLRSVVHVPEDNSLISTFHASFPEYMLDETRSKKFKCDESTTNEALAHYCFSLMRSELKFNMCSLENSYLTDAEVDDLKERISQRISTSLSYACRYWSSHLSVAPAVEKTQQMLLDFLSDRLLYWMEVLSLSGYIGIGAPMIQQAQIWLRHIYNIPDGVQKQLSDARNFVTWFAANPCSRSTPHIYISALPLSAKSSWVYQNYIQRTRGLASISTTEHDEAVLAIWSVESQVSSFSISPDGGRIATGSSDGRVQVYDMHTGAIIAGPFKGHTDEVNSISFSPRGTRIASGSHDKTIIVWDVLNGRVIAGPLRNHTGCVYSVAFAPAGTRIASGSEDSSIIVWDSSTGEVVLGPLEGHATIIWSVAFSPDGRLIASGSLDGSVRLWDTRSGANIAELKGSMHRVTALSFSPDATKLASCTSNATIRVWDVATGALISRSPIVREGAPQSVALSPDIAYIVSGGDYNDNSIKVWETVTGSPVAGPLTGHSAVVKFVTVSPDNSRVISSSRDRTIRIWDIQSKGLSPKQQNTHEVSVGPLTFLPNHTQFVSTSSSGVLRIWDMHTGRIIPREFEGQVELGIIHTLTVSPQGSHIAVISGGGIRVWSILTGGVVFQTPKQHKDPPRCLTFLSNGVHLCSGSEGTIITVWDIERGSTIGPPYQGHKGAVISVACSPDGACIASGSTDCTVCIWGLTARAPIHKLNGHKGSVSSVAFSPDGNYIVAGSIGGTIRTWEVGTGNCLGVIFEPQSGSLGSRINTPSHCVSFSPDGNRILSTFGPFIRLVNPQSTTIVSELSLPKLEVACWSGYSRDSADIITVSVVSKAGPPEAILLGLKQPLRANIVRIWRADTPLGQLASSLAPRCWSYEADGCISSPEGFVMWVPPDLVPHVHQHTQVGLPSYYNPLVLSTNCFINVGYPDLYIGKQWAKCFVKYYTG